MKTRVFFTMAVVGTAALLTVAVTMSAKAAQDAEPPNMPPPEEVQAMMAKQAKAATPGEHHKHLDMFAGQWNTVTKVFMGGPGSTPTESTGTATSEWILGKRYLLQRNKGSMMGQPFESLYLIGYDGFKNLYTITAVDNMNTQTINSVGTRDPSGKKFTFYGHMDEPMLDVYGRVVKFVYRIINENKYVIDVIDLHASDDYKVVEITYTRK